MPELAGDIEPTIKNWVISVVGASAHVCYALPRTWDLSTQPVITVIMLNESYAGIAPTGDVLTQLDCWAAPRNKAAAAALKSVLLQALNSLETSKYVDAVTGNMLAAAYNTNALWAPDLTTTTTDPQRSPSPTPRYSIITQLVTGMAPVAA